MKVTHDLRKHLVDAARTDKINARTKYEQAKKEIEAAQNTLNWAEELIVGTELTMVKLPSVPSAWNIASGQIPTLYFYPSKSGLSKGHYIKYDVTRGEISCSCPGFINRHYCWATREVLSGRGDARGWSGSRALWENNRDIAYNSYVNK